MLSQNPESVAGKPGCVGPRDFAPSCMVNRQLPAPSYGTLVSPLHG